VSGGCHTRLALAALALGLLASPTGAAAGDLGLSVAGTGRAYFIPDAFFTNVFDTYTNAPNAGGGLVLGLTGLTLFDPEIVVEAQTLRLPAGNFRLSGSAPWRTVRARIDLLQIQVAARLRFDWRVWRDLHIGVAVGGGVTTLLGEATTREVLPGCTEPVSACGAWQEVASHDLGMADSVLPLVIAVGHVGYEVLPGLQVLVEGGMQNLPFVGLSLRYVFAFARSEAADAHEAGSGAEAEAGSPL